MVGVVKIIVLFHLIFRYFPEDVFLYHYLLYKLYIKTFWRQSMIME